MSQDCRASVVLITSGATDNYDCGTGFVIFRDENAGFVLTCAHVVKDVGGPGQVRVDSCQAIVVATGSEGGADDLAVLRVEGLLDRPLLNLAVCGEEGWAFATVGFLRIVGSRFLLRSISGKLDSQVWVQGKGQKESIRAWELAIDAPDRLQKGYSGAPVVDEATGAVLGVVSDEKGEGKKGLAICIEVLEKIWPEMPSGLLGKKRPDRRGSSLNFIAADMKSTDSVKQPFVHGRPLRPSEFLDREHELRVIFQHLRNGISTAVIGGPNIGKSSLLIKIADAATQKLYLRQEAQQFCVSLLDLTAVDNDYDTKVFWQEALEPLRERSSKKLTGHHKTTYDLLEQAAQSGYARPHLTKLFNHLSKVRGRLVLLLDGIERLLFHQNFKHTTFFALLRSLSTMSGGVVLVIASHLSYSELNELGRGQALVEDSCSPVFNYLVPLLLLPFDRTDVERLLNRPGNVFSYDELRFIRRMAGSHPYLLQAIAAAVVENADGERCVAAARHFYERASVHFDDLWRTMSDRTRTAAVILGLVELGHRALGQDFARRELERMEALGYELWHLADLGLAEHVDEGGKSDQRHLQGPGGEWWRVGSPALAWWVRDVMIAGVQTTPSFEEWLANQRYCCLLSQEQWDWLTHMVRTAPEWVTLSVESLARTLFEESRGDSEDGVPD